LKDPQIKTPEIHPANVPVTESLPVLKRAAQGCTACPLYLNATQVVFGEGPRHPLLVLVGEQPGDLRLAAALIKELGRGQE
jgi:DNA polymerase